MHSYKLLLAVSLVALFARPVLAGELIMTNGDRLTGTIIKSDDTKLVIQTDYAGEVSVKLALIQQINSDHPLHVEIKNGPTVVGPIKTVDGTMQVESPSTGPVVVNKGAIKKIRNDEEEAAFERLQHPTWLQDWAGGINTSFALTRGNSETRNLALAFIADRKTLHDHLGLYANSVFATNDAPDAVPNVTAKASQGGIRYDHDFGVRMFTFTGADFQSDDLQELELRSVFSGGLGVHVIKGDRTTLDLLGGANYTRENYSTLMRDVAAANVGEEFMHKFGDATVLTEKLYAYPDFNDPGQYRATFNFGTVTKLNKWLGWQNSFSDIYVTNPPEGARQNDILLTTGLNISFTH